MSCSGLHCAGCGAGAGVPAVALAGLLGFTWVAEHLIEVAVVSAACGVLSVAAVVALMRWQDRRQAALTARGPLLVTRPAAAPQVTRGTAPPAVENHYHVHHHYAEAPEAARVIRQAVTNTQLPPGGREQRTR